MNNDRPMTSSIPVSVTHLSKDGQSDLFSDPNSTVSQDLETSPFKSFREKIENENIHFGWPTDASSSPQQLKLEREMKYPEKVEAVELKHSIASAPLLR